MKLPGKIVAVLVIVLGIIAATQISFSDDHQEKTKTKNPPKTVAHTITHTDRLSTFSVALKTANLEDLLNGDEKFTIFAPSDDAFARLPDGTYRDLMSEGHTADVRALVKHHIVSGVKLSSDLKNGRLATLAGDSLVITHRHDTTFVDGVSVRQKSITASNGVIYVIDRVLMVAE